MTQKVAWLATLGRDGWPHVTPVWFLHCDGVFWSVVGASSMKVNNIRQSARCSIAIDGSASHPLVAQCTAIIIESRNAPNEVIEMMSAKYDGWQALQARAADAGRRSRSIVGERVLLEMTIVRWLLRG